MAATSPFTIYSKITNQRYGYSFFKAVHRDVHVRTLILMGDRNYGSLPEPKILAAQIPTVDIFFFAPELTDPSLPHPLFRRAFTSEMWPKLRRLLAIDSEIDSCMLVGLGHYCSWAVDLILASPLIARSLLLFSPALYPPYIDTFDRFLREPPCPITMQVFAGTLESESLCPPKECKGLFTLSQELTDRLQYRGWNASFIPFIGGHHFSDWAEALSKYTVEADDKNYLSRY